MLRRLCRQRGICHRRRSYHAGSQLGGVAAAAAIPMQVVLNAPSLLARIFTQAAYPLADLRDVCPAALIGVFVGARVFISLDEGVISCVLAACLALIWLVPEGIRLKSPDRFRLVGVLHGFFGTIFGVGLFRNLWCCAPTRCGCRLPPHWPHACSHST